MNEERSDQFTRALFEKAGMEKPSADFTDHVMETIQRSKTVVSAEPLIGLKGWLAAAAGITALVMMALFVPNTGSSSAISNYPILEKGGDIAKNLVGNLEGIAGMTAIPTWTWMLGIAVLFFLAVDQLMKKSWSGSLSIL